MDGRVAVGEAARPHGLKGAVRVKPWLDDLEDYGPIKEVFIEGPDGRRLEVESQHRGGGGLLVWKFKGVDSREEAERLRGAVLMADRDVLPGPEENVYFWEDFEGLEVVDESGALIGRVEDMIGAKGNDVLVLRSPAGEEILLPALREVLLRREGGRWIVRPPRMSDEEPPEGEGKDAL
ncbi:MAG: ribosome maturation factor RimM [bacterium]